MKEDYSELDAAILGAITDDRTPLAVMSAVLADKVKEHCVKGRRPWRVIARRLQAMRKAGKIKYGRPGGWETA